MRIWVRQFKETRMLCDMLIVDDSADTRTHKVFNSIEKICSGMDIPHPIWLDRNIKEFKRNAVVKFDHDSFIEEIPFDYLELRVIEED